MPSHERSMILSAAVMLGTGMHLGSWVAREGDASDYISPSMYIEIAQAAERGKLHALFFADGITNDDHGTDRPTGALDPTMILSLMAAVTRRIGLIATASTTYSQPYEVARRFGSLDHLSCGRAGWNSVATMNPDVATQFGGGQHPDHADRYERAEEFIEVVKKLWSSWEKNALVGDKTSRLFAHADKVHRINHVGRHFSVRGPLPFPRVPQGRPLIVQAGSSSEGRDQAARHADIVFTAQHLLPDGVEFRSDIRRLAAKHGRDPDQVKVLPGILAILGRTEKEAWDRAELLEGVLGLQAQIQKISRRTGLPVEALELDKPFPVHLLGPEEKFAGSIGFRRSITNLAVAEKLTVRQLIYRYGGGHQQVVGTAEQVADVMEEWMEAGAADGFNLMVDVLPSGIHQVVEWLVPELQRRKLFQLDYVHPTLRENVGLAPVGGADVREQRRIGA